MSTQSFCRTKILATIGPASCEEDKLEALMNAGMTAVRLNFSHADHATHQQNYSRVRRVADRLGKHITILQDLQGPKTRIGKMTGEVVLTKGQKFVFDQNEKEGDSTRVCLPHPEIFSAIQQGDMIYINDGLVRTKVEEKTEKSIITTVVTGGSVSSCKGANVPGVELPVSSLTQKDKKDLQLGLDLGVDWVALSFVQRVSDIQEAREIIGNKAAIIAKIEQPEAVEKIDDIIEAADAIMIARGDLGVELPLEEVPPIQKKIIRLCREAGKPVVVATQMLESMIHKSSPTRAEVSDVAGAVYDGADVLMLSAETAAGTYPVEAVATMRKVIQRIERSSALFPLLKARFTTPETTVNDAITAAACTTANTANACAIAVFTETGKTALRVARHRPLEPVFMLTHTPEVARRWNLIWGVQPLVDKRPESTDQLVEQAAETLRNTGECQKGRALVVVAGIPIGKPGSTNMVRVTTL